MFGCCGCSWTTCLMLFAVLLAALVAMRRKREYLSGVDSVFVSGDTYGLIVVHAIVEMKTPVSWDRFRAMVSEHFASHLRFRQRIIKRTWRWHYFQTDEEAFKLENHAKRATLPGITASSSKAELQSALEKFVSTQIQTPINMNLPPWEFILIETFGAGSAMLFRVHHSIADGITLMRLAMRAFGRAEQGTPVELSSPGENVRTPSPAGASWSGASSASSSEFKALTKYKKPRPHGPKGPIAKGLALAGSLINALTLKQDPVGTFKPATNITPQTPTNACWLEHPLSLHELKQISYATGTSVNDILFYIVASALRQYSLDKKVPQANINDITNIMWVSMQGTDVGPGDIKFGNAIGAVYLPLPLSEPDDFRRLLRVRDSTSTLQVSPDAYAAQLLLGWLGLLPRGVTMPLWDVLAYKSTNSMSNMPGPQHAVTLAGSEIGNMVFFVPPQGTIASFLTILSYNGGVQMGCLSDVRVIDRPREVIKLFESEFESLKKQVAKLQAEGKLKDTLGLQDKDRG